ncbi:MAG: hypothetical protein ACFFEF_05885 [Candidatus Thorarchaeota archaeon]
MQLKAIRGRNQRGLSFLATGSGLVDKTVRITLGSNSILTRIRDSPKVPSDLIVIDSRLYDSLGAKAGAEVEVAVVNSKIPSCTELTLVVSAKQDIDTKDVVKDLSNRIEILEEHIDGLILRCRQIIRIPPLGISVKVRDIHPVSSDLGVAILDWKRNTKIYLQADLGTKCFNLILVTDVGAASKKADISLSHSDVDIAGDSVMKRHEAADQLTRSLIDAISLCEGDPLLSSIIYSEETDVFRINDSSDEVDNEVIDIHSPSISEIHSKWISNSSDAHAEDASNPSLGIERAFSIATKLRSKNHLPTLIVLLSSGAYSHGKNPVATAKKYASVDQGISLACVGLGTRCEESLLVGIADAAGGTVDIIKEIADIPIVRDRLIQTAQKEA